MATFDELLDECTIEIARDHNVADPGDVEMCRDDVRLVLEVLIGRGLLVTSERFDDDCHTCDRRIGDHAVDGRCPGQPINVIFDGPPAAESGRFVEAETDDGCSVNAGEWQETSGGLWRLRITALPPFSPTTNQTNTQENNEQ